MERYQSLRESSLPTGTRSLGETVMRREVGYVWV